MICDLCPRRCGAERREDMGRGVCRMPAAPKLARAGLHLWEEPCISGNKGSGAIFFSGCSLGCVFCQNGSISHGGFGKTVSVARLREIMEELKAQGAHNINLVNPTHFAHCIKEALAEPIGIPVVWNCGGYERVETLKEMEGLVDIYLPDLKYVDGALSQKYSRAEDYFTYAAPAILEMFRQTGPYEMDDSGMLRRGTVIRHL
ncbi:MAG: 4Fe-4S cluster-binding domain-containing protein, partial [Oscillospiraceae bacterium]|nr:4Fe-4S cluster-binding domain-containing protein [Oscillospiraceae bacterium]